MLIGFSIAFIYSGLIYINMLFEYYRIDCDITAKLSNNLRLYLTTVKTKLMSISHSDICTSNGCKIAKRNIVYNKFVKR